MSYYYVERKERIYLLFADPKIAKANLSDAEKNIALQLVVLLARVHLPRKCSPTPPAPPPSPTAAAPPAPRG